MGYAMMWSPCVRCGRIFGFNPHKVPSIRVNGQREPVCEGCYHVLAAIQKDRGMEVLPLSPDAYEAIEEGEL
jgi:hypothetical protein